LAQDRRHSQAAGARASTAVPSASWATACALSRGNVRLATDEYQLASARGGSGKQVSD